MCSCALQDPDQSERAHGCRQWPYRDSTEPSQPFLATLLPCSFPDHPRHQTMAPLASHVGVSSFSQGVTRSWGQGLYGSCFLDGPLTLPTCPLWCWHRASRGQQLRSEALLLPPVCRKGRGSDGATGPQPVRLDGHTATWDPQPPLGLTAGQSAVSFPTHSHRSPDSTAHPGHARRPGPRASPWTPRLQPLCLRPFPLPVELPS